jgi:hypothetical protein
VDLPIGVSRVLLLLLSWFLSDFPPGLVACSLVLP